MTRLASGTIPAGVAIPGYDRRGRGVGIVHFGIGAFMRAHQAWYSDRAMGVAGGDWMTVGVSMRSADVQAQLMPQDGLYLLAEKSATGTRLQLIGSVADVLVAGPDAERVVARLAAPTTAIVTFTVTEKGYCRDAAGGLDFALADAGFYPLLAAALDRRREAGLGGLTLLSCDNLADNGATLARLMGAYLQARNPALADWVAANCRFPSSMVDRIVPATTDDDRAEIARMTGVSDRGLVVTEPFSQWVIERDFVGARPAWDAVGAEIVDSVAPYETAKLRMLNGAHSALAYCGLAAGFAYVHEAVGDPALGALAARLMREEAAPTINAAPGQNLAGYADALLARFANPALNHRLIQIAMDGSQKIPQRWLATLAARRREGARCPAILTAIGCWLRHVRGDNAARWGAVSDPRAAELAAAWAAAGTDGIVDAIFAPGGLMASDWAPDGEDRRQIIAALDPPRR